VILQQGPTVVGYDDELVARIDVAFRSPNLVLGPGVTLTIAGSLQMMSTGVIGFAPDSQIVLVPHCHPDPLPDNPATQLMMVPTSLLKVIRSLDFGDGDLFLSPPKHNAQNWTAVGPFINATGCGNFSEFSFYTSTQGHFSQGVITMIQSGCSSIPMPLTSTGQPAKVLASVDWKLNCSCPNIKAWPSGSEMKVSITRPNLCKPWVAGIAVGTIAAGLLALLGIGAAAMLLGGGAAAGGAELAGGYVAM